jgi:hypothetical protein
MSKVTAKALAEETSVATAKAMAKMTAKATVRQWRSDCGSSSIGVDGGTNSGQGGTNSGRGGGRCGGRRCHVDTNIEFPQLSGGKISNFLAPRICKILFAAQIKVPHGGIICATNKILRIHK